MNSVWLYFLGSCKTTISCYVFFDKMYVTYATQGDRACVTCYITHVILILPSQRYGKSMRQS